MSYLCEYSFKETREIISKNPQIICAVSAPEPIQNLSLNINEFITNKIAERVSQESGVFLTSPVLQGIITPFKPIAALGTQHRRFSSLISDCVRFLCVGGVKKVFFITSGDFFSRYIEEGINNYKKKLPGDFSYEIICWQNIKTADETIKTQFENPLEFFRKESAIFLLANELKGVEIPKSLPELPFSKDDFIKWKKRGCDPEKLRKLSPNFQFSSWTNFIPLRYSFFEKICGEISAKILQRKL